MSHVQCSSLNRLLQARQILANYSGKVEMTLVTVNQFQMYILFLSNHSVAREFAFLHFYCNNEAKRPQFQQTKNELLQTKNRLTKSVSSCCCFYFPDAGIQVFQD